MKKSRMKLLAVALSVLMLLSLFAACRPQEKSAGNNGTDGTDPASRGTGGQTAPVETTAAPGADLVGSWAGEMDMTAYYNEAIKAVENEAMADALSTDELIFTVRFDVNEDGTCTFCPDKDTMEASLEALKAQQVEGMRTYLTAQLAGTGVTLNQLLSAQNMDLEAMLDQSVNPESLLSTGELETTGTYKVTGNKLYIAGDGDTFSSKHYVIYEVSGDTLTLKLDTAPEEHNAMAEMVFPMRFTRR